MTTDNGLTVVKFLAALGCGLMAGVFFTFSAFVMKGFARIPAPQGIAAMQSVNITAVTPLFMTALFGTAACLFLVVSAFLKLQSPSSLYLLVGGLLYLIGVVIVTIAFNVPLNDTLAKVEPNSVEGASVWANYLSAWTMWNHVRTLTSLAAAASFTLALFQRAAH